MGRTMKLTHTVTFSSGSFVACHYEITNEPGLFGLLVWEHEYLGGVRDWPDLGSMSHALNVIAGWNLSEDAHA